jgi:hypothetical protein
MFRAMCVLLDKGYAAMEKQEIWHNGKEWWDKKSNFEPRTVFCLECKDKTDTTLRDDSFGHCHGTEAKYMEVTVCCGGGFEEL